MFPLLAEDDYIKDVQQIHVSIQNTDLKIRKQVYFLNHFGMKLFHLPEPVDKKIEWICSDLVHLQPPQ